VRVLDPRDLTPEALARHVDELLAGAPVHRQELDLCGLARTGDELESLLEPAGVARAAGARP
jgi:predicted glycosyltransferase